MANLRLYLTFSWRTDKINKNTLSWLLISGLRFEGCTSYMQKESTWTKLFAVLLYYPSKGKMTSHAIATSLQCTVGFWWRNLNCWHSTCSSFQNLPFTGISVPNCYTSYQHYCINSKQHLHCNLPTQKQKNACNMSRRAVFWHCCCCYIHVTVWTTHVGRVWTHRHSTSNNHWKTIM